MAKELHISIIRANYQTTTCIALGGVALFLWVPLPNNYGRRPVLLGTTLLVFITTVNGSHIAPLPGGPLGQYLGWRWCFKFGAICDGVMVVVIFLFCLPGTLFVRPEVESQPHLSKPEYSKTAFVDGLKIWD
ncbi:MAG: hypothetical protein Q9161_006311 [Pseudevernia consocians]